MENVISDQDSIRTIIENRRADLHKQERINNMTISLRTELSAKKQLHHAAIEDLRESNPNLHSYIRRIENLQVNFLCEKCAALLSMDNCPETTVAQFSANDLAKITALQDELTAINAELQAIRDQFYEKLIKITQDLAQTESKIDTFTVKRLAGESLDDKPAEDVHDLLK